jgi:uncharacterized protein YaiI (UPF0178 family)
MKVIVDADACPVKEIVIRVCRAEKVPVLLISCLAHALQPEEGVSVVQVDTAPQSADIAIINALVPGDIVVTADYGLAALVLGGRGRALSPRGFMYLDENIDALLEKRHLESKVRRGGGRTKGPRAFSAGDRRRFEQALVALLRLA